MATPGNPKDKVVIPQKLVTQEQEAQLKEEIGGLTYLQWMFINEYSVDFCGKQAAIRAGYAPATAHVQASKQLKKPAVQKALATVILDKSERTKITSDMVLTEYAKIAFSSIGDICDWTESGLVNIKASEDIPDGAMGAICEVSRIPTEMGMAVKVKMHDKLSALKDVAKHLGMFNQNKVTDAQDDKYSTLSAVELAKIVNFQQKQLEAQG